MYALIKRFFDIILASGTLIILAPVLIMIAICIKLEGLGPIIFAQRRAGMKDVEFKMYKFRTMIVGTPEIATDKLRDSTSYVTKVGYYLRKYSLDELPQLFNIFRGDMSFVGPRPALYNQYDLREKRNKLGISTIKPGLTGWAQINGRDDIMLDEKVNLDLYYLQKRSFLFDLKIIYRTAFSVSAGNGVTISKSRDNC